MAAAPGDPLNGEVLLEPRGGELLAARFTAMASPCEVLFSGSDPGAARACGAIAAQEAWRIEKKFSRYRSDSVTALIHEQRGRWIEVDEETAALLDFAGECFAISGGLFDITSGILRRAWTFDGGDRVPEAAAIERLVAHVGFGKLTWRRPRLLLPPEMELDFGGIGKEYAVDRIHDLLCERCPAPFLVNLGGDLRASRRPPGGPWQVGIERPDRTHEARLILELEHGALATSGDSRRFVLRGGVRYSHILDPRTGWPVHGAPRSVSVAASSCIEAGLLATLAMLHGAQARSFLDEQQVKYWLINDTDA